MKVTYDAYDRLPVRIHFPGVRMNLDLDDAEELRFQLNQAFMRCGLCDERLWDKPRAEIGHGGRSVIIHQACYIEGEHTIA